MDTALWTLDELGSRVALALAVGYDGQANGRVRDVPDRRTIRYYTTLGLIDRPAAMRGRTALYGIRHLLQLAAIKRLQTHGLSLAEIQTRLVGCTSSALRKLAQVPADLEAPTGQDSQPEVAQPSPERDRFWSATPVERPADSETEVAQGVKQSLLQITGLQLADGATLLLHSPRPLDAHDVEALRVAAAPLLKLLVARRLLAAGEETPLTKGETS